MPFGKRLHVGRRHEQTERPQRDAPEPALEHTPELPRGVIARRHDVAVQRDRHAPRAPIGSWPGRSPRDAYRAISHGHTRPMTDAISTPPRRRRRAITCAARSRSSTQFRVPVGTPRRRTPAASRRARRCRGDGRRPDPRILPAARRRASSTIAGDSSTAVTVAVGGERFGIGAGTAAEIEHMRRPRNVAQHRVDRTPPHAAQEHVLDIGAVIFRRHAVERAPACRLPRSLPRQVPPADLHRAHTAAHRVRPTSSVCRNRGSSLATMDASGAARILPIGS